MASSGPPSLAGRSPSPAAEPRGRLLADSAAGRPAAAWWTLASVGLLVGGIVHFVLAPIHFEEAEGQGLFFLLLASVQVGVALALGRHRSPLLLHSANAAAAVSFWVYAATRVMRAPYGEAPEGLDWYGIVSKGAELLAAGAACRLLAGTPSASWEGRAGRPALRVAASLLASLLFAAAILGLGYLAEDLLPALGEGATHHH